MRPSFYALVSAVTVLALFLLILVSPAVFSWVVDGGGQGPFREVDWELVGNAGEA